MKTDRWDPNGMSCNGTNGILVHAKGCKKSPCMRRVDSPNGHGFFTVECVDQRKVYADQTVVRCIPEEYIPF